MREIKAFVAFLSGHFVPRNAMVILPSISNVIESTLHCESRVMISITGLRYLQAEQRVLLAACTCTLELSLNSELLKCTDVLVKHFVSCVFT